MRRWPDYVSVIFNQRQCGKTATILEEIHTLAVQNRTPEVLVVVPDMRQKEWLVREWRTKWPSLTPPTIISIQNTIPVRGRRFEKVYVENIEIDLEGIYSDRIMDLWLCLVEARDPELVFTCSPMDEPKWQPAPVERQRAIRKARRDFLKRLLDRNIDATLSDHEEEGTDQDS